MCQGQGLVLGDAPAPDLASTFWIALGRQLSGKQDICSMSDS